jgi:HAD superfamily hydrolase (TIGR01509 family)
VKDAGQAEILVQCVRSHACKCKRKVPVQDGIPCVDEPKSMSPRSLRRSIQAKMVKALLCDIDGTLVQSNWLHAEAWQVALGAMNIHVDREDLRRQIGKGGDELIPYYVPWWKEKHVEKPLKALRRYIFHQLYMEQVEPIPRARDFLLRLKQAGIRPSLATSASKEDLKVYKKLVDMEDLIEEESSADDADRSKPHPDIFLATLKRLKLKPAECLALGDTPYDAEAAGKAGVWTIGVETGGWTARELLAAGCIEVYKDVGDLLDHFEQSALMR